VVELSGLLATIRKRRCADGESSDVGECFPSEFTQNMAGRHLKKHKQCRSTILRSV
jgi:hypothetical protein